MTFDLNGTDWVTWFYPLSQYPLLTKGALGITVVSWGIGVWVWG